jgi:hypothetical protein
MNDFKIGFNWAVQTAKSGKPVISDQFFSPFTPRLARKLRKKLIANGHYIWPLGDDAGHGALIIRKDSKQATFEMKDGFVAGIYTAVDDQGEEYVTVLGASHFNDTIGKM